MPILWCAGVLKNKQFWLTAVLKTYRDYHSTPKEKCTDHLLACAFTYLFGTEAFQFWYLSVILRKRIRVLWTYRFVQSKSARSVEMSNREKKENVKKNDTTKGLVTTENNTFCFLWQIHNVKQRLLTEYFF